MVPSRIRGELVGSLVDRERKKKQGWSAWCKQQHLILLFLSRYSLQSTILSHSRVRTLSGGDIPSVPTFLPYISRTAYARGQASYILGLTPHTSVW